MAYKKTYWMNVVLTAFAALLAVLAYDTHVAEHGYAHLPIFIIGYSFAVLTPLLTAIGLKKTDWTIVKWTAIVLNVIAALLFIQPLYHVFTSTPYIRLIYIADAGGLLVLFTTPSLINLKALRNQSK